MTIRPKLGVVTILVCVCGASACTGGSVTGSADADVQSIHDLMDRIERTFNSGDLDAFLPVFANDAVISAHGEPDIVGIEAIRSSYVSVLDLMSMTATFSTDEVAVVGDLAFERGTYTVELTDRSSGQALPEVRNRHIHIFQRQPNGDWKTWRMMTNSAEVTP